MISKPLAPKVGLQVLVVKDGRVLIGKDGLKGKDVYGVPAGHWHSGETLKEGAKREVMEESGVVCGNLRLISVYDFFREDKGISYVSIGYLADYVSGELSDNVGEERLDWDWISPKEALELNLYPAGRVLIEKYFSSLNDLVSPNSLD